jgi:DNA-binding transcriptional ArsR family regulator
MLGGVDAPSPTTDIFHAIADAHRRALLDLLAAGDMPAQDLAARFPISFAAVSQHLKILREAGLVARRAEGRRRIYRLTPERLRLVAEWTAGYQKFWTTRLKRLGAYLDARK